MIHSFVGLALLAASAPTIAAPLTVKTAETWLFSLDHGDPVRAHKVEASAKPAKGEIKIAVRALFGTTMTISNNSPQGYTFKAELIGADGKAVTAKTCTLPAKNQPALESWPQKAVAVRVGTFQPANGGLC